LWIREKESLYFAALKKDVVWLKKNSRRENWNACKWLEAEEIDKISHQTFMVESYPNKAAASMLSD
jgi:hypothetical protein